VRSERGEDVVRRRRLAEHVAQHESGELVEHGDDRDRQHRRVRAITSRRLAVAARPVAGDGQEQGGEAERAEHAGVREQTDTEPGDRAEDCAAQQGDADEGDEDEVWVAAEDVDVRHHRQLNHDDEKQQPCGLRYVSRHQGAFGVRLWVISAVTASSAEKST
jgi:hypothetical protein